MSMRRSKRVRSLQKEGCQPGMGAFDHPPMASEPVIALNAPAGDTVLNAAALEVSTAPGEVITLVRMQLARPAPRPAWLAAHGRQSIHQRLEDHRIMAVGPGDAEHHRDALAVRDQVALGAEFAPVRRVGPCVRPPGGWARWLHLYRRG